MSNVQLTCPCTDTNVFLELAELQTNLARDVLLEDSVTVANVTRFVSRLNDAIFEQLMK